MTSCPFCSDILLRHIRAGQIYWLCRRCHTEILGESLHQPIGLSSPEETVNEEMLSAATRAELAIHHHSASVQISTK